MKEELSLDIKNNFSDIADFQLQEQQNKIEEHKLNAGNKDQKELEKVAGEFTSILINKMFSAMKKTLNDDNKLLDGGYAEDVFSDMLYKEYSQMAGKQGLLADLNRALVEQLKGEEG